MKWVANRVKMNAKESYNDRELFNIWNEMGLDIAEKMLGFI